MREHRSFILAFLMLAVVFNSVAFSEESFLDSGDIPLIKHELPSDPEKFSFAILGDKTGGGQENWPILDRAVEEINLLDPDFVITVGDQIQGYTNDPAELQTMWEEYMGHVSRLKMPVILIPGNHDISNTMMYNYWREKLGRTYYSFDYKGCHFVVINSEEHTAPEGAAIAEKAQVDFVLDDIEGSRDARYTFVFMHRPLWREESKRQMWEPIESALKGVNCTVFAGHYHALIHELRNDQPYIVIGATGAGLDEFPEPRIGLFHHFALVSVEGDDASVAIARPGGIFPQTISERDYIDRLEASLVKFRPEMPVPRIGERVTGRLTAILNNKVDKPLRFEIRMAEVDETLWTISPTELVIEASPGEEKQMGFELTYSADSLSAVPKYTSEEYYDGKPLWKRELRMEMMDTSSMRKMGDWMVVGPFDIPGVEGKNPTEAEATVYEYFLTALEPETDSGLGRTYKSGLESVTWQAASADDEGSVDLNGTYDGADYAVAYAQAFIRSPEDTAVWGAILADDIASVSVNGRQLGDIYKLNAMRWQYLFFLVPLEAGWNQVMVKCGDCAQDWSFIFGLEDVGEQLEFSARPVLDPE